MNRTANKPQYTLLSLSMTSSDASVKAAFELVQKFSFECEALLVNAPAEERKILGEDDLTWRKTRETVIKEGAAMTGIQARIISISFEDSLSHFKFALAKDVFMLLQPVHPLERQSPSFIQLNEEIYKSPGIVIYLPDQPHKLSNYILLAGQKTSKSAYLLAQTFSDQSRLPLKQMDYPGSIADVQNLLLAKPPSQRPALLIMSSDISENSPLAFFKLAALTGVPIGVIPNRNNEDEVSVIK